MRHGLFIAVQGCRVFSHNYRLGAESIIDLYYHGDGIQDSSNYRKHDIATGDSSA